MKAYAHFAKGYNYCSMFYSALVQSFSFLSALSLHWDLIIIIIIIIIVIIIIIY